MPTTKEKSETAESSELGRKYTDTVEGHLAHLLNIGWKSDSPLIKKYVAKNKLEELLEQWRMNHD